MLPYLQRDIELILKGIIEREKEVILKYGLLYTSSNADQVICMISTEITPKKAHSSPKFNCCSKSCYPFLRAANNPYFVFQGKVPESNPNKEIPTSPHKLTLVFHLPET